MIHEMIRLDEALTRLHGCLAEHYRRFATRQSEQVALADAVGRVLAERVIADYDHPPAAVSAMDGYALRSQDTRAERYRLRIIAEHAAGASQRHRLGRGEAVRIYTGGVMPFGSDAVVLQEDCRLCQNGTIIETEGAIAKHAYVRACGMDFRQGALVLQGPLCLRSRHIGLLAAVNHAQVAVAPQPRVGVVATGDELVPLGSKQWAVGKIIASTLPSLLALSQEWGGQAIDLGIVADNDAALQQLSPRQDGRIVILSSRLVVFRSVRMILLRVFLPIRWIRSFLTAWRCGLANQQHVPCMRACRFWHCRAMPFRLWCVVYYFYVLCCGVFLVFLAMGRCGVLFDWLNLCHAMVSENIICVPASMTMIGLRLAMSKIVHA